MGECVCATGGFCRPCHCRRVAVLREASPGYRERHQQGLDRWANGRALDLGLRPEERPEVARIRHKGFPVHLARKIVIASRRHSEEKTDDC